MNHPTIPIAVPGASRQRKREAPKGRRVDPQALQQVRDLLGTASRQRDLLIEHLHKIQDRFGCLAAAHLAALAQEMRLAQSEVYEVATFYHHFDVLRDGEAAPAALTVRVCAGLSCEMAGAQELLSRLPAILGTEVRVIAAPCIGRCEQAPAALVGQNPVPHATVQAVAAKAAARDTTGTVSGHIDYLAYREQGGYRQLRECIAGQHDVEAVIGKLENSNLRGLGGAGFPAGRKWRIVRAEAGPRLMAINLDEGEPGTFKDRVYLERDPHRFIEGALIAAWAVGIEAIYIYLRDEYHGCRAMLEAELDKLCADPPVQGMPPIHLRRGCARPTWRRSACSGGPRWSTTSRPCTGCATSSSTAPTGSPATGATDDAGCARSRSRAACASRASSWRRPASPSPS
jgi:formate dehydrogenase